MTTTEMGDKKDNYNFGRTDDKAEKSLQPYNVGGIDKVQEKTNKKNDVAVVDSGYKIKFWYTLQAFRLNL